MPETIPGLIMITVLHIASFKGNIGDNANHKGVRRVFEFIFGNKVKYTELEIRKAYQNYHGPDKLYFNHEFVSLANKHDLVIFGGGDLFGIGIDPSQTGTTIDMDPERLKEITVPIIFYALGCDYDPYKGASPYLIEKFKRFIDTALAMDNCIVSVRNDGAINTIRKYLGEVYCDKIIKIPDGGFFIKPNSYYHPEYLFGKRPVIAVNLAKDMKDRRFQLIEHGSISYDIFSKRMCGILSEKLNKYPNLHIVFVPHIYSDIEAIADVVMRMDDTLRRNRISVAPYVQGEVGSDYLMDLYRRCNLVLGMRFHANVCPIGLGTPTIGLVTYHQIRNLYEDLGLHDRFVTCDKEGFESHLSDKIDESLEKEYVIRARYERIVDGLEDELLLFNTLIKERFFPRLENGI